MSDPIERVFALRARYRHSLKDTDCFYGCPIGSLALELHEPDPLVRERLAANFTVWIEAIHEYLEAAGPRLPPNCRRRELAAFVLTTMAGGVMQARTYRTLQSFDAAVRRLRCYFDHLLREAAGPARAPRTRKTPERP